MHMTETNTSGSRIIRIIYMDRYIEDGIIRSKTEVKTFESHQEIEANEYYINNLDKHYMIEKQIIDIHITQKWDDKFNCY